jgi:glucose/arabinose dehydrogenase
MPAAGSDLESKRMTMPGQRRFMGVVAILGCLGLTPRVAVIGVAAPVVDVLATGLEAPWALAFDSRGTLYISERPGRLRILRDGRLQPKPLATFDAVATGEAGLMGVALDPSFDRNRFLYVCYTTRKADRLVNRVSRLIVNGDQAITERVLLDDIPAAELRTGGRLKFGPDGMLYVTTGDTSIPDLAQQPHSLAGKILRIAPDGSIPRDNPFPGSPVYAVGFRNPQGLAWDGDRLLASDLVTGPHDEINHVVSGGNYGWPVASGATEHAEHRKPLIDSAGTLWKPSGIAVRNDTLYVAALLGQSLLQIRLRPAPVAPLANVLDDRWGRLRDVVVGPDAALYVATSNRDGRGTAHADDDRILRVRP